MCVCVWQQQVYAAVRECDMFEEIIQSAVCLIFFRLCFAEPVEYQKPPADTSEPDTAAKQPGRLVLSLDASTCASLFMWHEFFSDTVASRFSPSFC